VGALLSALGLVSVQALSVGNAGWWLALGSVTFAILAVLADLIYLGLRLERLNVADLGDVERWYGAQFKRAHIAVLASWLLVVAVLLAALSAIATVVQSNASQRPALDMQLINDGNGRRLQVGVKASGLHEGAPLVMRVVALAGGCPEVVLLESRSTADDSGKVEASGTIESLPCNDEFRVDVSGEGVQPQSLAVP
jgi:hypothetical protein